MERVDNQLFQYKNSTNLNALLDVLFSKAEDVTPENLQEYFNVDLAVGAWLTQLAKNLNVNRNYFSVGEGEEAFVLDLSDLDSTDILDGLKSPMDDDLLRAMLKARILRNTVDTKTIDYIYNVFFTVFGEDLDIEIQYYDTKAIQIIIDFGEDTNGFRILQALIAEDDGWFGRPTGVQVIYDIDIDAK